MSVLTWTVVPGPISRLTAPVLPWKESLAPVAYDGVEVAVPENRYWFPYWVLASCLTPSISWLISAAEEARSAWESEPLEACTTSSLARCTMLVMFDSEPRVACVHEVPSLTLLL